jgi:hypothetical protein
MTMSLSFVRMAVAGFVGNPFRPALLVWVDAGSGAPAGALRLQRALTQEIACLRDRAAPASVVLPEATHAFPVTPHELAERLDLERVLCAVIETADGTLYAMRNYEGCCNEFLRALAGELARLLDQLEIPASAAGALFV